MLRFRISGQSITELAIIFAVAVGVYMLMQMYVQRSFQAKYKAGADYVHRELAKAAPALAGEPRQYDNYYTDSWRETSRKYNITSGYPYNSVDQEEATRSWILTDAPGQND